MADEQVDGEGAEDEGESPSPATIKKWQFWKKKSTGPKKFGWIKGVLVSGYLLSERSERDTY